MLVLKFLTAASVLVPLDHADFPHAHAFGKILICDPLS